MSHIMDNEQVSDLWYPLLKDLREVDGIDFNVNEGRRTMARQAELVREKGLWSLSNQTGAARPSANAPHIRVGRPDHAIDFNNAAGVIRGAAKRGVRLVQTVMPHEPWHLEIASVTQLRAYNERRKRKIARLIRAAKKAKRRWKHARTALHRRQGR